MWAQVPRTINPYWAQLQFLLLSPINGGLGAWENEVKELIFYCKNGGGEKLSANEKTIL
jgi:hypothetical protein